MTEEFRLGLAITEEIMVGKVEWERLFEPSCFFTKYKHFIVLLVSAVSQEDHLEWYGLVESKLRHLIGTLERNPHITLAHVNPETFIPLDHEKDKHCTMWFIGLEFARVENLNVDLTYDIQTFTNTVHRQAIQSKMLKDGMKLEARHVRKKQLSAYVDGNIAKREKKWEFKTASPSTPTRSEGRKSSQSLDGKLGDSTVSSADELLGIPASPNGGSAPSSVESVKVTFGKKRASDGTLDSVSKKLRTGEESFEQEDDSSNTSIPLRCNDDSCSNLSLDDSKCVEETKTVAPNTINSHEATPPPALPKETFELTTMAPSSHLRGNSSVVVASFLESSSSVMKTVIT